MIEITDSAVRQLRTLVGAAAEKGLRIGIAKGGCSGLQYEMTLGVACPGDAVIARDALFRSAAVDPSPHPCCLRCLGRKLLWFLAPATARQLSVIKEIASQRSGAAI